jgi:carbonic anhydrase
MIKSHHELLAGNAKWVKERTDQDPDFFTRLANGQRPKFLWIGCSDSRVAADQITNTNPGEIFVHRNIANLVVHTDINLLSVLQYAVEILKVEHIIVCGHYGCGGVNAALSNQSFGLIDNWLRNLKDVYRLYAAELDNIEDPKERERRLVECSIHEQVYNLSTTSVIQAAWATGKAPVLHGWVYDVADGVLHELLMTDRETTEMADVYRLRS